MAEKKSCVESLLENDPELTKSAVDVLLKISANILGDPTTERYRNLSLSSSQMERSLFPAVGALEVLFCMGFQEDDEKLTLPLDHPLDNLKFYQQQLLNLKQQMTSPPQLSSPQLCHEAESSMKTRLIETFRRMQVYENAALQEVARRRMPLQQLQKQAQTRMQQLNTNLSNQQTPFDIQDCLLMELLAWFKKDFFRWFDKAQCPTCVTPMTSTGSLTPTQQDLLFGGGRVEGYICEKCGAKDRFVRYNDPKKLLETRYGRCGEWANCFTLLCRALGMDARYVLDWTDHVWTEVYSSSQKRWLHTDPCENKLDCPLLYEQGWNKKLSYIIAFSKDEAVDVTWRYTCQPKQVCSRRTMIAEAELVSTLLELSRQQQASYPPDERRRLDLRRVAEVAQFLAPPRVTQQGEVEGRLSGSVAWRMARGEMQQVKHSPLTLTQEEVQNREFVLKYSAVFDQYQRGSSGQVTKGWQAATTTAVNITRKQEHDWKMSYLARTEGTSVGEVTWAVDWKDSGLCLLSARVELPHTTYDSGSVTWRLNVGHSPVLGSKDGVLELSGEQVGEGVTQLEVWAQLSNGTGDQAWQHAQLFRQSNNDTVFPFLVHLKFEGKRSVCGRQ